MYRFTPDEIDHERAHHQAVIQGADDLDVKRIGNLGELAFEQFCREYLPVEMWEWENEEAIRRCNPESVSGHDFEVFGYTVDVKSSRDVSAFLPESLVERDPDDDPPMSVVIDAALTHLVESEENIRTAREEYDPVTIQELCNTSVLGLQYRTQITSRWR